MQSLTSMQKTFQKILQKKLRFKNIEGSLENAEKRLKEDKRNLCNCCSLSKSSRTWRQKKPYIFEALVSGGDIEKQFAHVKESLGKEIKIDQIFETGATVDVAAITKGHGWQGVLQKMERKKETT